MTTFPDWNGQPYYPISSFYKRQFGEKVYKITVSAAQTCPHRQKEGQRGNPGCIFCDEWGSAGNHLMNPGPLAEQISENRTKLAARFRVNKFLVYFQPYSNTYTQLESLRSNIALAIEQEKVVGVVLGTRPDCLPDPIFPMLKAFHEKSWVSIELGAQSFVNERLEFLNRRHTAEETIDAIHKLHDRSGVDIGVHLIFGIPGETDAEIIDSAKLLNSLPVDNVKLHHLHVLTNTPLAELYHAGKFEPITLDAYAQKVGLFLSYLSPNIAVQRLAAVAARWDELIAPEWTKERMRPTQVIQKKMKEIGVYQGIYSKN